MHLISRLLAVVLLVSAASVAAAAVQSKPIVIAHRGDSGNFPEHTLEAYQSAIDKGADFIEPDLVITKDGVLVARHDIYLSTTTNVADKPEFAARKRIFEGRDDWFVFDFTFAELQTLRARQSFQGRTAALDDRFKIPTYEQVALLAHRAGRPVGLYPEMKRPDVFRQLDLKPSEMIIDAINDNEKNGLKVILQCFYPDFLIDVRDRVRARTVLLLYGEGSLKDGTLRPNLRLEDYLQSVDGIGISKNLLALEDDAGPGAIVRYAHNRAALVHVWTLRDDTVPVRFEGVEEEIRTYLELGVDGLFADFPATARAVVDDWLEAKTAITGAAADRAKQRGD